MKVVNHDNVHENYVDDLILEEDIYVDDEPFYVDDEPFVAERVVSTFWKYFNFRKKKLLDIDYCYYSKLS